MGIQIIKSFAFCVIIVPVTLGAQDDYYPPESFYGGGVGFSQMFLFHHHSCTIIIFSNILQTYSISCG